VSEREREREEREKEREKERERERERRERERERESTRVWRDASAYGACSQQARMYVTRTHMHTALVASHEHGDDRVRA